MSIPVPLGELGETLGRYGYAYLLTVADDGRPHAVAVDPVLDEAAFVVGVGNRSRANVAARSNIALVFPPAETGGYSLIVDADGSVDGERVRLVPTKAVLHRPATPGFVSSNPGCVSDCVRLTVE